MSSLLLVQHHTHTHTHTHARTHQVSASSVVYWGSPTPVKITRTRAYIHVEPTRERERERERATSCSLRQRRPPSSHAPNQTLPAVRSLRQTPAPRRLRPGSSGSGKPAATALAQSLASAIAQEVGLRGARSGPTGPGTHR